MAFILSNFASTTLVVGIAEGDLVISVVDSSAFAAPVEAEDRIPLVIEDINGVTEIVYASAVGTDQFTVERNKEGTAPAPFAAGSRIECRLTAAVFATQLEAGDIDGGEF